ncbi:MAG: hypothetical protein HY481_00775 [Candidatus Vogelbacteria bacterium]|nr:hypothetical protein [Candidatus Vogelbacteria bacterium]
MDILGKLFGGTEKIKVMRLFVLNPETVFDAKTVAKRSKISPLAARRETVRFRQFGLIKKAAGKKPRGWQLNPSFPFLNNLRGLLRVDLLARQREITDRFAHCGKIKLLIIAGLFIQTDDSRADLLLVGDKLKRGAIERVIKMIEAEVGRELVYAAFDTADFLYRLNAYDKFIRDILDYPHEKIIDRLGLDK